MALPIEQKLHELLRSLCVTALAGFLGVVLTTATAAAENAVGNGHVTEGYVTPHAIGNDDTKNHATNRSSTRNHVDELEIWVADVGVQLFNDSDIDGYFAGFRITLDVDIEREWADVYAEIYVQPAGTSARLLHATNVFSIFNRASSDVYQVELDLTDNFLADDYNVLIDIVNANTARVVDTVSSATHANLEGLPLESVDFQANLDGPSDPLGSPVRPFNNDDGYYDDEYFLTYSLSAGFGGYYDYYGYGVGFSSFSGSAFSGSSFGVSLTSSGVGGSTGWLTIFILGLAAAVRKRRRAG